MRTTCFSRFFIATLLLSGGELQAQSLVDTYKKQEELRISVGKTCKSQFEKAQYHPVEGRDEDLRYMISAKGVQGIKDAVVPTRSGGSFKCARGSYEKPMLLGRTYRDRGSRDIPLNMLVSCPGLGLKHWSSESLSRCAAKYKERLELESCRITLALEAIVETSCLIRYDQYADNGIERTILAFRRPAQAE